MVDLDAVGRGEHTAACSRDAPQLTHRLRRVAIAVCPGAGRPVAYFTFRPDGAGAMVEDRLVRGVHPMVGRRLNLWRLRDFEVTRLEAPEDVLLYLCTAPGNEADQRLVALAQEAVARQKFRQVSIDVLTRNNLIHN